MVLDYLRYSRDWHKNTPEDFRNVSKSLATSTNIRIDQRTIDGNDQLCLLEGYDNPIPMWGASDGHLASHFTLRLD